MVGRIHHVGMTVVDLEQGIKTYKLLGFQVYKRFSDPGYKAAMLYKEESGVELWQFDDPNSELAEPIKKHVAFASNNLESDLQLFIDNGYMLSLPITETSGAIVKRYVYVKDTTGNYIELCEPSD